MVKLPENILKFISENRLASISYITGATEPCCFPVLYAFDENENCLIFKSSLGTEHECITRITTVVAGTILPEKFDLLKMRGIQFKATSLTADQLTDSMQKCYYSKFPFARLIQGYIWAIKLHQIKYTDNGSVFARKTEWLAAPIL